MPRVKRGVHAKKKRRKILKAAKGYRGARGKCYTVATENVERGLRYGYAHRRTKKRELRSLWIARINAAVRERGMKYSDLVRGLAKANIALDRKILSDMAINDPAGFARVVDAAKSALSL
jgi:large subunit ribosomal protein L20